jgi:Zn-dependent protease with chaperone function
MKEVVSQGCFIAHSGSFFRWKRIFLGASFFYMTPNWQRAVKAHELGHIEGHHTEWRILTLLFCPFLFFWVCRKQEFLADEYAAKLGLRAELINFLEKLYTPSGRMYPSNFDRIEKLRLIPVKDKLACSA